MSGYPVPAGAKCSVCGAELNRAPCPYRCVEVDMSRVGSEEYKAAQEALNQQANDRLNAVKSGLPIKPFLAKQMMGEDGPIQPVVMGFDLAAPGGDCTVIRCGDCGKDYSHESGHVCDPSERRGPFAASRISDPERMAAEEARNKRLRELADELAPYAEHEFKVRVGPYSPEEQDFFDKAKAAKEAEDAAKEAMQRMLGWMAVNKDSPRPEGETLARERREFVDALMKRVGMTEVVYGEPRRLATLDDVERIVKREIEEFTRGMIDGLEKK